MQYGICKWSYAGGRGDAGGEEMKKEKGAYLLYLCLLLLFIPEKNTHGKKKIIKRNKKIKIEFICSTF
jgi:hypothetical protein